MSIKAMFGVSKLLLGILVTLRSFLVSTDIIKDLLERFTTFTFCIQLVAFLVLSTYSIYSNLFHQFFWYFEHTLGEVNFR